MLLVWIISLFVLMLYGMLVMAYRYGWSQLREIEGEYRHPVSVVAALRNEEQNIESLLNCLLGQDYPEFEIILVDDHSEDRTAEIIKDIAGNRERIKLVSLDRKESGKKDALEKGIRMATNPVILNTDADCRMAPGWISSLCGGLSLPGIRMVAGSVQIDGEKGLFSSFQALEHFSLTAVSGGSVGLGSPVLSSAASIAFMKDDYLEFIEGYKKKTESGDDIFLMLWLKKKYPGSVLFSKDPLSMCITSPAEGLSAFFHQRIRWASKGRFYRDFHILFSAAGIFLMSLLLLALLAAMAVSAVFRPELAEELVLIFGISLVWKSLVDLFLLFPVLRNYGKTALLVFFIPLELVYFIYICLTGIGGQILPYKWKERKH